MSNKHRARKRVGEILGRAPEAIVDDAQLTALVNSSFRLVELVIELQEEFDVRFDQADMNEVTTVGQLVDLIDSRAAQRDGA